MVRGLTARIAVIALAAALVAPAAGAAQAPTQDSVTGTNSLFSPLFASLVNETYDAVSRPSGENPSGSVAEEVVRTGFSFSFDVTCLAVTDNRAVIGIYQVLPDIGTLSFYRLVVDGGPGGVDRFGSLGVQGIPRDCATAAVSVDPTEQDSNSDVVVTDAKPFPTAKAQCLHGGWHNYPQFKNLGQCLAFVLRPS